MTSRVALAEVQGLLGSWWYDYDEANFDRWPQYFTTYAHYTSRSDSGASRFEDVVHGDYRGRDRIVSDLAQHRAAGLYPLRHFCMNAHLLAVRDGEADFRCYVLVTRVADQQAMPIASGRCSGTVRLLDGELRIAAMNLVFDLTDSGPRRSAAGHRDPPVPAR